MTSNVFHAYLEWVTIRETLFHADVWKFLESLLHSCRSCSLWMADLHQRRVSASAPPGAEFGARTRGAHTHSPQGSVDIDSPSLSEGVMAEVLAKRRCKERSFETFVIMPNPALVRATRWLFYAAAVVSKYLFYLICPFSLVHVQVKATLEFSTVVLEHVLTVVSQSCHLSFVENLYWHHGKGTGNLQ